MTEETSSIANDEAVEHHGALRSIFWVVPLYAVLVGIYAVQLMSAVDQLSPAVQNIVTRVARVPGLNRFIGIPVLVFFVCLAGIAFRSVECARIMKADPFRAFGMGRFILLFYLCVSIPLHLVESWPKATLEASLSSVVESNDQFAVIKIDEVSRVSQVTVWTWLLFLAGAGHEFFIVVSLYAFTCATYDLLAKGRQSYVLDNFVFDITFGRYGVKYARAT